MTSKVIEVTKGHFLNLDLRSYGQLLSLFFFLLPFKTTPHILRAKTEFLEGGMFHDKTTVDTQ